MLISRKKILTEEDVKETIEKRKIWLIMQDEKINI